MVLPLVAGAVLLLGARYGFFPSTKDSGSQLIKIGGLFVSLLSVLPYREIGAKRERLAIFQELVKQFRDFDQQTLEHQTEWTVMATKAIEETLKR